MMRSKLSIPVVALVVFVVGVLSVAIGVVHKSSAQDEEKSLDIARYPNEPLELIDIKIGDKSVKDKIKLKSKNSKNGWGRDNVKFRDKDGWVKSLKIKLRNISGRPITGMRAVIHFEHPNLRMLFSLLLTYTKSLDREPLQPGDEIDLEVSDLLFSRTMARMSRRGVEANGSSVSFSVDTALFSNDLKWSRGVFLRRDPNNPNKWDAIAKPAPTWSQPDISTG